MTGNDFNSAAAAFSHKGKGNYQDAEVQDGDFDDVNARVVVDAPEEITESARAIGSAAEGGDLQQARLEAAKLVGGLDDSAVSEARERIEEQYPTGVEFLAPEVRVSRDANKIELNAGSGNMVNVAKLAIKIVEGINASGSE